MRRSTDPLLASILIVDDQEANIRLLAHILRREGYVAVTSTMNSPEVCALHRENGYDLILLDLQMPLMNGFEVLAALQDFERADRPAILVMSADPSQSLPSLTAGATSFLSKPFVLADVLARVQVLLDRIPSGATAPVAAPKLHDSVAVVAA